MTQQTASQNDTPAANAAGSDINELERIEAEARAAENEQQNGASSSVTVAMKPPGINDGLEPEIAALINLAAGAGGLFLPTIPQRFNPDANLRIAAEVVNVGNVHQWDLKKKLLGEDSKAMAWIGLLIALAMPSMACVEDWRAMKAKEVKEAGKEAEGATVP